MQITYEELEKIINRLAANQAIMEEDGHTDAVEENAILIITLKKTLLSEKDY